MKLVKITSFYPQYLRTFYNSRPSLRSETFEQQAKALNFDAFAWADSWTHALTPLGYEVFEITSNAKDMQLAWAKENAQSHHGNNWLLTIARDQVLRFKPEVLFMDDYVTFDRGWVESLRRACPSIRLVLGWCGAKIHNLDVLKSYDCVLSCIPEAVESFQLAGFKSYHIHHAFEPRILERLKLISVTSSPEVSFVGQIDIGRGDHRSREQLLEFLAGRCDLNVFSPLYDRIFDSSAKDKLKMQILVAASILQKFGIPVPLLRKDRLPDLRFLKKIKSHLRGPVYGLEMYNVLRSSLITLNNHIDVSPRSASNMRMFEATGVGACLLTDWKENLQNLFEPDKEVLTYRNHEEAAEKIEWLLAHPQERDQISKAAQKRCLAEHTFSDRAIELDRIINKLLK